MFYRINIVRLQLPSLRDRREDISFLVEHFISKFNRLQDKHIAGGAEDVMANLLEHDYPGNIRELENIIEHAFVLCHGGLIESRHLPTAFRERPGSELPSSLGGLTLKALEKMHITEAIRRHEGSRTAAAKELGINPSTLFRRINFLGIELPDKDGAKRRYVVSQTASTGTVPVLHSATARS